MNTCFAIVGEQGEYDYFQTWTHKIFMDKSKATIICRELNDSITDLYEKHKDFIKVPLPLPDTNDDYYAKLDILTELIQNIDPEMPSPDIKDLPHYYIKEIEVVL